MPGMITLPEYAKGLENTNVAKPFIETFARSSDIFERLPFDAMTGASYEFYRQAQLPTPGFRAINAPGTSGMGKIEPLSEASFIIDHDLDVDRAIIDRHGMERRSREEINAMAAVGRLWTDTFLKGDNGSNPTEFNGVQKRSAQVFNGQSRTVPNSVASGGAPLSLLNLDRAINRTRNPNAIIAPLDLQPNFIAAARNTAISGFVIQSWDEVGKPKMSYAGLPILWGYPRDLHGGILPFTEVGAGGGAAQTTSLYIVSFGEEGLHGIQVTPMAFKDFGLLENGITYRTHFNWDVGLVDEHPFCVTRLSSITNGAFTA
jgi:hypothetical protein